MSPTQTEISENLVMDGPLGVSATVLVAILLLLLFTWSLFQERSILGRRYTALFWSLRAVALGVAMWMLLAPTKVMVETSTTRQSIAIVMDISGSMQTVDPMGTSDDLRWLASTQGTGEFTATTATTATTAADQAVAAAGIAELHLQRASVAIKDHQPESLVAEETTAAEAAIAGTRENLEILSTKYEGSESSRRSASGRNSLTTKIAGILDGPEIEAFRKLSSALQKGRTPAQKGWRESLPDLQHRMSGVRRQLSELARDVAEHETRLSVGISTTAARELQKAPRLARTAGFLTALNERTLTRIREKADVRISTFDKSMVALKNPTAPGIELASYLPKADQDREAVAKAGTNVTSVLEQLTREQNEQPLAAVFLFSDMGHNKVNAVSPREAAPELRGVPVYVVPVGNSDYVRDVVLQSVFAPSVAMRNDDIVIEASLQAYDCAGESVVVRLLQDGAEIAQEIVEFDSGFATRKVRFDEKMSVIGTQTFQVAISAVDGELTERNNFDDFEVNVTRSDLKLLLADEMPRWEHRYLTQLFRRDPKMECDEILFRPRMIATGRRQETQAFPETVDGWDQYDVVLLGDLPPEHLPATAQESLIDYLKNRGGTLVMMAGNESMPQAYQNQPLEQILPVSRISESVATAAANEGYAFHVTEEGRNHNALMIGETEESTNLAWSFVNQFAPLNNVSLWRQPRPSAHTLIAAVPRNTLDKEFAEKSNAFLCWQPVGRGMIIYLSGPDTYRLRFLRGDRLHYRFWGQLLRWAIAADLSVGSDCVRVRSDKSRYAEHETVNIVVRLSEGDGTAVVDSSLQILARRDNDDERTAELVADSKVPGQYTAQLTQLPPGVYRVEPIGASIDRLLSENKQELVNGSFTVQANLPLEFLDTRSDRALAQQIADLTGGQVLPPTAVEEVLNLTNLEPKVTRRPQNRPLWLEWKYLWIVFGCLQTEWIVRKLKGLS